MVSKRVGEYVRCWDGEDQNRPRVGCIWRFRVQCWSMYLQSYVVLRGQMVCRWLDVMSPNLDLPCEKVITRWKGMQSPGRQPRLCKVEMSSSSSEVTKLAASLLDATLLRLPYKVLNNSSHPLWKTWRQKRSLQQWRRLIKQGVGG